MTAGEASRGGTLSRELSVFLVQLSVALHKFATYPAKHPVVETAVDSVYLQLTGLLQHRETLALGVARNQLIVEGAATEPENPVLSELAHRLHRHQIGAIRFSQGVDIGELTDCLRTISVEASRADLPLGLRDAADLERWRHIHLMPLTFEQLQFGSGGDEDDEEAKNQSRLWLGLASAALVDDGTSDATGRLDPASVAGAINARTGDRTYDQIIVGYLRQLGRELKLREGAEAVALQQRISQLLDALDQKTLRRLLEVGGDLTARAEIMEDLSGSLPVRAVLDLIKASADTEQQTISHSLLRLLSKLAEHADTGPARVRPNAEESFRDSIQSLVSGWTLDDPNPEAYSALLQRLATPGTGEEGVPSDEAEESARIIQMALEIEAYGEAVGHAVDQMAGHGRLDELIGIIDEAPEGNTITAKLWDRLASPERVSQLLASEGQQLGELERVLDHLGDAAAEPMLEALETADTRAMRHRLLTRLATLGERVGPLAAARLPKAPWYVQRNLLILLGSLPAWPADFTPAIYAAHSDSRVRREAFKLMLQARDETLRDEGIVMALVDTDDSILRIALTAALTHCPDKAMSRLPPLVDHHDAELRVLAIRVLGTIPSSGVRDLLLSRVRLRRKWWQRRVRLAPGSPESVAAITALAAGWRNDPAVAEVLRQASMGRDPDLRAAAGKA